MSLIPIPHVRFRCATSFSPFTRFTRSTRFALGAFAVLTSLALLATPSPAATTDVYIASADKGIYLSKLDTTSGALTPPQQVSKITGSGFLALNEKKTILYATGDITGEKGRSTIGGVIAFTIQTDGSLTEINWQPAKGKRLCHISLDASSRMLMAANYGDGTVISFPVTPSGNIKKWVSLHQHTGKGIHKRQTKPHAHSIYAGPDNRFAYAPDLGIDKVMIYAITPATAQLKPIGFAPTPAGSGPRHLKFSKNGKQAYVLNELSSTISVFDRTNDGKLIHRNVTSTLPDASDPSDMTCSEIRISNNGLWLYCANRDLSSRGRDSLSVFRIADNGDVKRIQTIVAGVSIPRNINLDPTGNWLLVAGQKSNNVPVFQIDTTTGKLTPTFHSIPISKAMCIEFVTKK